jgi:hypothetical protein
MGAEGLEDEPRAQLHLPGVRGSTGIAVELRATENVFVARKVWMVQNVKGFPP